MTRLTKTQLFHVFEDAVRESGWSFLYLSPWGNHPARYQVYNGERSHRIGLYIWNLTPGGQNRPEDEWRIQVTGITGFEPEIGGKTLILGWRNDIGVFAGFDLAHHSDAFGASPSIQLRETRCIRLSSSILLLITRAVANSPLPSGPTSSDPTSRI